MSRNFELLQSLGKEGALLEPGAVAEPKITPSLAPEPITAEPQLKLEPMEREELAKLVQRVFLLPGGEASRVVVFAATESGNGSSWIVARTAELLAAQVGGTVWLVDANLRNPELHRQFSVENQYGLADALRGPDPIGSYAQTLSRPNLRLLSSGSAPETALSLLSSERMRQRIAEMRSETDYVLIDAAALNVANDATALSAAADGVVMVLKANSSRRESARKTLQDLQTANVRVLGAVLNQRTFPIPEAIYNRL